MFTFLSSDKKINVEKFTTMCSHAIDQSTNHRIVKIRYTQFLKTTRCYLDIAGRLKRKMKKKKRINI